MKGWLRTAWRDMGPWKWVGVAAILTVIVLTPATARATEHVIDIDGWERWLHPDRVPNGAAS